MAYRVAWSPRAIEDLEAIAQYISADSSAYAATVVKTILSTTRNLSRFPFSMPYWRLIVMFAPRLISGDPFKAFRKRFNPFQGVYVYAISASFTAADRDEAIT